MACIQVCIDGVLRVKLSQFSFSHCLTSFAQVGAEIPMDSDEADQENKLKDGKTLLYVFERGFMHPFVCNLSQNIYIYIYYILNSKSQSHQNLMFDYISEI